MKIGIIGRTAALLNTAKLLHKKGFCIPFIYTCKAESFYNCNEEEYFQFSKSINTDYFCDLKINDSERIQTLRKYECDLALSLNWLTLLKDGICQSFTHGIWNAHAGDLPRYRGNACPNWAILNNEQEIGLSVHEIEPNSLDSGDIILKNFFSLKQNTYISEVYDWMEVTIPEMFYEGILNLKNNTLNKQKQSTDLNNILRCYPRKPNDSKIDWKLSNHEIHQLIRASSKPFNGAFCYLENGEKVIIWQAEMVNHKGRYLAIPGQVLYAEDGCPVICCGDGLLKLTVSSLESSNENANCSILKSLRNRLI
ncbi:MAG: hypothetical protein IBJ00_06145 [Alphaproteobacteria bacterium]|nr:hypothetical protein [Alphaproteobacteria bacterium]